MDLAFLLRRQWQTAGRCTHLWEAEYREIGHVAKGLPKLIGGPRVAVDRSLQGRHRAHGG